MPVLSLQPSSISPLTCCRISRTCGGQSLLSPAGRSCALTGLLMTSDFDPGGGVKPRAFLAFRIRHRFCLPPSRVAGQKQLFFAKSAPTRAPPPRVRTCPPAAGTVPPTPPPPCRWGEVTSPCPPAPRHRGGRAPGTRIGTGAAPEPPKTPLGLLGLVVVAGGSRTARYWG